MKLQCFGDDIEYVDFLIFYKLLLFRYIRKVTAFVFCLALVLATSHRNSLVKEAPK